jgi:hypothetical protein
VLGAIGSPKDVPTGYFWPTPYTFLEFVVPLYILAYPLLSWRDRSIVTALAVVWGLYLLVSIPDANTIPDGTRLSLGTRPALVHALSYFGVMLAGMALGRLHKTLPLTASVAALSAISIAYVAAKALMVTGTGARWYPILHALTCAECGLAFIVLTSRQALDGLKAVRPAAWVIHIFSTLSLEIYLVQFFIIFNFRMQSVSLSYVLFWVCTVLSAYAVSTLVRPMQRNLLRMLDKAP